MEEYNPKNTMQRDTFSVFKWQLNYIICLFMFEIVFVFLGFIHNSTLRSFFLNWMELVVISYILLIWVMNPFRQCVFICRVHQVRSHWDDWAICLCLFKWSIGVNRKYLFRYNNKRERKKEVIFYRSERPGFIWFLSASSRYIQLFRRK